MKIKSDAKSLLKRFVAGAPCPVNLDEPEKTMFGPWLEAIAKGKKITIEMVKKYWFTLHNGLVKQRYEIGHLVTKEDAQNCMVSVAMHQGRLFCFHGGRSVCSITKEETKTIKQHTPKLIRTPR
jgi:hypothetical protein